MVTSSQVLRGHLLQRKESQEKAHFLKKSVWPLETGMEQAKLLEGGKGRVSPASAFLSHEMGVTIPASQCCSEDSLDGPQRWQAAQPAGCLPPCWEGSRLQPHRNALSALCGRPRKCSLLKQALVTLLLPCPGLGGPEKQSKGRSACCPGQTGLLGRHGGGAWDLWRGSKQQSLTQPDCICEERTGVSAPSTPHPSEGH